MSPHAANSLVHDLVQMAQAMEQLPQVQANLAESNSMLDKAYTTIQRLELRLIERANEIDTLNAAVREAEAARDNAETMFLQADDRTMRAVEFIKAQFGAAGSLIQALEPAKPQPVEETVQSAPISYETLKAGGHLIETEPPAFSGSPANIDSVVLTVPEAGQSEVPLSGASAASPDLSASASPVSVPISDTDVNPSPNEPPAQGQSAADPTPVAQTEAPSVSSQAGPISDTSPVTTQADVPSSSTDIEPTERWSTEWWQWKDRQPKAAE